MSGMTITALVIPHECGKVVDEAWKTQPLYHQLNHAMNYPHFIPSHQPSYPLEIPRLSPALTPNNPLIHSPY